MNFRLGVMGMLMLAVMPAYATPAVVNYIFDGDTFAAYVKLEDGIKISVRVRLMNVDTPEIHGACAREIEMANRAKNRLAELIPVGSTVELSKIKDDKYLGRIDAHVIMPDGRDVGDVLVHEKLGRPYSGGRRAPWCD
ncbi:MAG: thermonuclease family protein [Alphaproteobacteria bacterium]|nr:thermonuclease family protein [Alphaproteobacteria bacterium]MDE6571357.1 thermonuclease family protein [Alphaproteobacteria bacterium]